MKTRIAAFLTAFLLKMDFFRPPENGRNNNIRLSIMNNPNLIPSVLFLERYGLLQYLRKNGCSLIFNLNEEECHGSVEVILNNDFYTVKNPSGKVFTPTYISFAKEKVKIGQTALNDYRKRPEFVVFDILKMLGKSTFEIQQNQSWQFSVAQHPRNPSLAVFEVQTWEGRRYLTPELALAMYLKAMKRYAEGVTKQSFRRVAIMVPGCYRKIQHTSLKLACNQAGMNLVHTMQAPKHSYGNEDET